MPSYVFAYHSNGKMPATPEEGAALEMAQASPFLDMGTIEVAQVMTM